MSALTILTALGCGRGGCSCARSPQQGRGMTHCPSHGDTNPSLSVTKKGGRVLVKCFGGCEQREVIAALRERGLWQR